MGGIFPAVTGAAETGLFAMVPGTPLTAGQIAFFQALGFKGLSFDPRLVYDWTGLVINGLTHFRFKSQMASAYEYNGVITYDTGGYIITDTGSPADGVQIYASAPSPSTGNPTAGLLFEGLVFAGAGAGNSNAGVHLAGGERDVRFTDCLFYNPSAAVGSYGLVNDTAISDNNGEAQVFTRCQFYGGYAGYGIGINDLTQRANDCEYYSCRFSGGTYGIDAAHGGGHNLHAPYERSRPTGASYNNRGATLHVWGGEDLVNTGAGVAHNVTAGTTVMHSANLSQGAATNTVTVSGGTFMARGDCILRGTISVSGSGTLDLNDSTLNLGSLTITGTSTNPALLAAAYPRGLPAFTAWTGTITYGPPMLQAAVTNLAGFALQNATPNIITWTTPNDGQPHTVDIKGNVRVTVAESAAGGTIAVAATDPSGGSLTPQLDAGGHGVGTFAFTDRSIVVGPNTAVTVQQTTALTSGAAATWPQIWGA